MQADGEVVWGIYPGKHYVDGRDFEDDSLFPVERYIAVGWPATGDLAPLGPDRNALYARVAETHADVVGNHTDNPGRWFARATRILNAFVWKAQPGDAVVYACKTRRIVYVGRILAGDEGAYRFHEEPRHWHFKHLRAVRWLAEVPYEECSRHDLAQIRTQNVFWRMKACPGKFLRAL